MPRVAAERTIELPYSPHLAEFADRFVADGWYQRDYRADRGWPRTDRGQAIVLEQDIATPDDHRYLPMHNELMVPFDLTWWAGVTFRTPHAQYVLSMFRGQKAEPFSEQDRAIFARLSTHLGRAVTLAERLGRDHTMASLALLEARGEAAILLDGGGRVLEMTEAAEARLGGAVCVAARSIVLRLRSDQKAFDAMIAAALRGGEGALAGPLRLRGGRGEDLLVEVVPVPAALSGPFIFARLMVVLIDLRATRASGDLRLRRLFGLTDRESSVVGGLLDGLDLPQIADRHGISRETARTHLKSIFEKTGTNRQGALIALVLRAGR